MSRRMQINQPRFRIFLGATFRVMDSARHSDQVKKNKVEVFHSMINNKLVCKANKYSDILN